MEPKVCTTRRRYEVLKILQKNGLPTVVWLSPVLPFLNDTEENLRGILDYCFDAGVKGILCFGMGVTLRDGSRPYFYAALDRYFPGLKQRYKQVYGNSYECMSRNNDTLMRLFHSQCERHGIWHNVEQIFSYLHEFPEDENQMCLFDLIR